MTINIPAASAPRIVRHVLIDGRYRLLVWDTYRREKYGKYILGYAFYAPNATEPLFVCEDFGAPAVRSIDDDAVVRGVLGFITLKPGDTDPEYFADYNEEQMAFAEGDAGYISLWSLDEDMCEGAPSFPFVALEGDPWYEA